ncbi:hypothetical protein CLNEO_25170 [Anaerotignum neopropionicum]|uniref:Uncharacterized protein n=1 Tax=Anaerotignum neopropionicum TaxID=36847 RepID=A0A136WCD7_9FIRM|nr:hypothetical protein [Anaerotignum neopropionicum]KXL52168.1 hypothetical protein CLNEO_25170 [Anaerotignum neopropionicum]
MKERQIKIFGFDRDSILDGEISSENKAVLPKDEDEAKTEWTEGLQLGQDTYKGWIATTSGMKVESHNGKCETIFVRENIFDFTQEFEHLISLGKFEEIENSEDDICINKDILSRISFGLTAAQPVGDMPDIIVLPQDTFHLKKDYKTVEKMVITEPDEEGKLVTTIDYKLEDCPVDEDFDVFDGGGIAHQRCLVKSKRDWVCNILLNLPLFVAMELISRE